MINATICEIIHDGKLLLQRKAAGRFWEGKWNGPGGKVDPGETPMEGVLREVREETGLTIHDPEPHIHETPAGVENIFNKTLDFL